MAEFCLECWNEINGTDDPAIKYVLSREPELCEGCGEWKLVVVAERRSYCLSILRLVLFPFVMIGKLLYVLWRILILPYLLYRQWKKNRQ